MYRKLGFFFKPKLNKFRELQALPKIIALLDSEDEAVQEKTVEVLWNLAGNDENRVAILYAGVFFLPALPFTFCCCY